MNTPYPVLNRPPNPLSRRSPPQRPGRQMLEAFQRAAKDTLRPNVLGMSLLPLLIIGILVLGLGFFFWADTLVAVRGWLAGFGPAAWLTGWLTRIGLEGLALLLAPVVLLLVSLPVIIIGTLLLVALFMTPALVKLVASNHPDAAWLAQPAGGTGASLVASVLWSAGSTVLAVLALLVSMPLWLIPPLILVLPPLIWGWLTYRVMAFDALADHASTEERRLIFKQHRMPLLGIGILSGYLGTVPGLVWASGVLTVFLAPILVPLAIWLYTLVFAFSSLWFAHYALGALAQLRAEKAFQTP